MGVSLTKQDVFELLSEGDSQSRLSIAKKICIGYNESLYAVDEMEIAQEILRLLAKDSEVLIRSTISHSLKLAHDLPHDIALGLAQDIEEVALPMLEFSQILTDSDLLEIIYNAEVQKLLAISRREKMSVRLAKGLIDKNNEKVTSNVLENPSLTNHPEKLQVLIEETIDNEIVLRSIINQSTLPATVQEKLLTEYCSNIMSEIKNKYHIVPAKLDKYVSHSLEISTLSVIDHESRNEEIDYLVNHLSIFGRLSPSLILSSLCMGRHRFFVSALAKRAGIPKANAKMLISKGGKDGVHALLRRAGIPEKLFEAVELVLVLVEEKKHTDPKITVRDFCSWLVTKLEYFADKKNIEYITYMIAIAKQSQKMRTIEIY